MPLESQIPIYIFTNDPWVNEPKQYYDSIYWKVCQHSHLQGMDVHAHVLMILQYPSMWKYYINISFDEIRPLPEDKGHSHITKTMYNLLDFNKRDGYEIW